MPFRCLFGEISTLKVCRNQLLSTCALHSARSASPRIVSIELGRDRPSWFGIVGKMGDTQVLIRTVISSLLLAVRGSYDHRLDRKKDPKVYIR